MFFLNLQFPLQLQDANVIFHCSLKGSFTGTWGSFLSGFALLPLRRFLKGDQEQVWLGGVRVCCHRS